MKRKFQCKAVPSGWIEENGCRLDCGPYMSGTMEIRETLKEHKTDLLPNLTSGHDGGIYNGPQFGRNYVVDGEHGVPFLTTTFMMQADLSRLPFLRRKDALSNKLKYLRVAKGMTLVTCSGTVGRTIYARSDMDDVWSNQDILKIVANPDFIRPGYLNAYLCTKFGVPFVVSGKYGSVITHLEPVHFSDLLVPRLADVIEKKAHDLIEKSASLLTQYQANLNKVSEIFFSSVSLNDITPSDWHSWGSDLGFTANAGIQSLRALNFNPRFNQLCERIKQGPWKPLGELCVPGTLKRGGRYGRIDADPEYSYLMIGQKQIFWLRPEGRWIAKSCVDDEVLVNPGTILIAGAGTFGESELYCRSEFIWGKAVERAYSELFYRVVADEKVMPRGCLFAFMRSETAFRMFRSISFGSKLQYPLLSFLHDLPVPYPPRRIQEEIQELVISAFTSRDQAIDFEDQARTLVEQAIEQGPS